MEDFGEIPQGEWGGIMSSHEEAEFMAQLLGNCSLPNDDSSNAFMYSSMSSFSSFDHLPFSTHLSHHPPLPNNNFTTMDSCTVQREEESKKRCLIPCQIPISNQRRMKCSKCGKVDNIDEDRNKSAALHFHRQKMSRSSNCCLEDKSNELIGTTSCSSSNGRRPPNPNARTRASRGSATDPQSLYARKRRERINERLGILQTLVPNGTKVDISTMLEEAVEYVKFLQLQIKMLSSDDLWMYAPIAYNGMDIGLDFRSQSS
ncbi:hypothetical protein SASPL_157439 [Salvia splendens]|uniref:BHLH domain-containing protein n=1 Tax=Salvia splendens TaxID=180675 RepID=A0A8X8YU71_SALSN|nr:transcription factor bHLH84-like [Salvia splendens]KAG6382842.1 hypothetical protein SASPL_157439 [Salvia splendens]